MGQCPCVCANVFAGGTGAWPLSRPLLMAGAHSPPDTLGVRIYPGDLVGMTGGPGPGRALCAAPPSVFRGAEDSGARSPPRGGRRCGRTPRPLHLFCITAWSPEAS